MSISGPFAAFIVLTASASAHVTSQSDERLECRQAVSREPFNATLVAVLQKYLKSDLTRQTTAKSPISARLLDGVLRSLLAADNNFDARILDAVLLTMQAAVNDWSREEREVIQKYLSGQTICQIGERNEHLKVRGRKPTNQELLELIDWRLSTLTSRTLKGQSEYFQMVVLAVLLNITS